MLNWKSIRRFGRNRWKVILVQAVNRVSVAPGLQKNRRQPWRQKDRKVQIVQINNLEKVPMYSSFYRKNSSNVLEFTFKFFDEMVNIRDFQKNVILLVLILSIKNCLNVGNLINFLFFKTFYRRCWYHRLFERNWPWKKTLFHWRKLQLLRWRCIPI